MKTYISKVDGKWYAFAGDAGNNQVYSIGADNPSGGRWCARWSDKGIQYVASASASRSGAYQKAKRHGEYQGEV